MASLGELERAVMERLWAADGPLAATTLRDQLADRVIALTTVHTVLTRLEQKGFVVHDEDRPWTCWTSRAGSSGSPPSTTS